MFQKERERERELNFIGNKIRAPGFLAPVEIRVGDVALEAIG